jgi:hypothetical protein
MCMYMYMYAQTFYYPNCLARERPLRAARNITAEVKTCTSGSSSGQQLKSSSPADSEMCFKLLAESISFSHDCDIRHNTMFVDYCTITDIRFSQL